MRIHVFNEKSSPYRFIKVREINSNKHFHFSNVITAITYISLS